MTMIWTITDKPHLVALEFIMKLANKVSSFLWVSMI